MRTNKKYILYLGLSAIIFLAAGCTIENPVEVLLKPNSSTVARRTDMQSRFQNTDAGNQTAIDSVMELSARLTKLTEEIIALKTENQRILDENQTLNERLAPYEAELKQSHKELAEANDLLIEMRIELNNWQTDILGFRNEMRQADKAQLEALLKILKVLGGETNADSATKLDNDATATASDETENLQPQSLQAGTNSDDANG